MHELDSEINALFIRQDELKKLGRDRNDDIEYMQNLYRLRDLTRQRNGIVYGENND